MKKDELDFFDKQMTKLEGILKFFPKKYRHYGAILVLLFFINILIIILTIIGALFGIDFGRNILSLIPILDVICFFTICFVVLLDVHKLRKNNREMRIK